MASKRVAVTALPSLRSPCLRHILPATRTQSTLAASSSRYAQSRLPLPSASRAQRISFRQPTVSPVVGRGDRTRSFGITASLRREADPEHQPEKKQDGQDISFKQYKFEDISSALPTSPSSASSPPSTPILIDVREPAELSATGKIPTAVCLPIGSQPDALFLSDAEFLTRFGFPKPTTSPTARESGEEEGNDMVFYCRAGVRARAAAQLAVQAGYDARKIGVYDGSWLDWENRGGRAEKWDEEE